MPTLRCISCLLLLSLPCLSFAQIADSVDLKKVDSLIQVSRTLTDQKDYDGAFKIHALADSLALVCCGPESAIYGSITFNKGRIFHLKRAYADAERNYLLAKSMCAKTLGTRHQDYLRVLNNLGNMYTEMGKYAQSEACWREVVEIRAALLGKDHPDYAFSVNQWAMSYTELAQFDKAEPLYLEIIASWEAKNGRENADYAVFVNNLGLVYLKSGRNAEAESRFKESMQIREKVLGKDHPDYASSLNNLANLYFNMGYYERAEPLCIAAKDIREKVYGRTSSRYAWSVNNLSSLYAKMGKYEKADPLLVEALQIKAQVLGKEHPDYATSVNNQGILYMRMGNFEKAIALFEEAQSIRGAILGNEHPDYAASLEYLAMTYASSGRQDKAEPLLKEALRIEEKMLGDDHNRTLTTRTNLAAMYMDKGDLQQAEPLLAQIMDKLNAQSDTFSEMYMSNLVNYGQLYQKQGAYDTALGWLEKALFVYKKNMGEQDQYVKLLFSLSATHWAKGERAMAEHYLADGLAMQKRVYTRSVYHLSEEELGAFLNTSLSQSDYTLSFAETNTDAATFAYDDVLFHKGFLLNVISQISQAALIHPEITDLYEQIKGLHRRLATEYAKAPALQKNVPELETEANTLEKELSQRVAGMGQALRQVTWQEVQAQLKTGEASIEFVHYQRNTTAMAIQGPWQYGALVLLPDSEAPRFIPLCTGQELEQILAAGGPTSAATAQKLYGTPELYRQLWQPLESTLAGVKTVYFSPVGLLHQVNLEALATNDGSILADHYQFIRLRSTRQLAFKTDRNELLEKEAVLMGGIQYDANAGATDPTLPTANDKRSGVWQMNERDSTKRIQYWPYLKWTKTEVSDAADELSNAGWRPVLWTDASASESHFKTLGQSRPSPRVLHLATHGFFFSDSPESVNQNGASFQQSQHPMIRSGLILAGANYAWKYGQPSNPDSEDGILTAYEISQMNFQNTELVVLSACETGLGDIRGNEGVYGLQRAFKIAGARNLIMSLWQVPDYQTKEFMRQFYAEWLEMHLGVPEAFYSAQRKMRARYSDPFYWAGFVLMQ